MYSSTVSYPAALGGSSFPSSRYYNGGGLGYYHHYQQNPLGASSNRFRDAFTTATRSTSGSFGSAYNPVGRPFVRSSVSAGKRATTDPLAVPIRALVRGRLDDVELNTRNRLRFPSVFGERTRDDLIDSIMHTRTREHRAMPGFKDATSWEERKSLNVDCDKVYPGVYLANGETIQNIDYLKSVGVTHVLNTAERHVQVSPAKYPLHNISYFGFHVDDHPSANISRFFTRTSDFIDEAVSRGGTVVVNCVMGWSRSAVIVAAYLVAKKGMTASEALEHIRMHRPIRPNPGFLEQLANYENLMKKRLVWE